MRAVRKSPGAGILAYIVNICYCSFILSLTSIAHYIVILKQIDGLAENFCLLKYAHAEVGFKYMLLFEIIDIEPKMRMN